VHGDGTLNPVSDAFPETRNSNLVRWVSVGDDPFLTRPVNAPSPHPLYRVDAAGTVVLVSTDLGVFGGQVAK
jgi:hypothetical protein